MGDDMRRNTDGSNALDGIFTPFPPSSDNVHDEDDLPLVPWLDDGTARYLRRVVALVARTAPEALAAILFGSVARHEERPLTDSSPSDVDLLIIFMAPTDARLDRKDTSSLGNDSGKGRTGAEDDGLTARQHQVLSDAVVRGLIASPNAARDVNVTGALAHFARWDPWFVEQIARDGILLWARGPLPRGLAPIEVRGRLGKRGQGR